MVSNSNRLIHYFRVSFLILAWIFVISIIGQTFIAGLAIFSHYSYWNTHTQFVVFFQFIPVLMLVLSFLGKLSKQIRWQSASLFLLIVPLQYISINVDGLGAIHPVVALVLFALAVNVIKKMRKLIKE
jgi:hypothetical protein